MISFAVSSNILHFRNADKANFVTVNAYRVTITKVLGGLSFFPHCEIACDSYKDAYFSHVNRVQKVNFQTRSLIKILIIINDRILSDLCVDGYEIRNMQIYTSPFHCSA